MLIRIRKLAVIILVIAMVTPAVILVRKYEKQYKANQETFQRELKIEQDKHKREIEEQDKASQDKIEQQKIELESEIERLKQQSAAKKAQSLANAQKAAQNVATAVVPHAQASGSIQEIIVKWANYYGVDANMLLRIAKCESGFNPNAINRNYSVSGTHPSGLFQHVAVYWPARAARYGVPGASVFDADANARVTAGMFRDGQASAWECK